MFVALQLNDYLYGEICTVFVFVFEAEEIEFIMSNYTQLKNCSAAVEEV